MAEPGLYRCIAGMEHQKKTGLNEKRIFQTRNIIRMKTEQTKLVYGSMENMQYSALAGMLWPAAEQIIVFNGTGNDQTHTL